MVCAVIVEHRYSLTSRHCRQPRCRDELRLAAVTPVTPTANSTPGSVVCAARDRWSERHCHRISRHFIDYGSHGQAARLLNRSPHGSRNEEAKKPSLFLPCYPSRCPLRCEKVFVTASRKNCSARHGNVSGIEVSRCGIAGALELHTFPRHVRGKRYGHHFVFAGYARQYLNIGGVAACSDPAG
jgi:hypothetical protein